MSSHRAEQQGPGSQPSSAGRAEVTLALEVWGFGIPIGAGAGPGQCPSFPDKAWATWCPLLATGPPAPAPKWPHSQHPRGAAPTLHTPPPPPQLTRSPLSSLPLDPDPSCPTDLCVGGGASAAQRPQAMTAQPLGDLVSGLSARAGGPVAGKHGTTGPCSLGPRHIAPFLSDFSLSRSSAGGIPTS